MQTETPKIAFEITSDGLRRITIGADDDAENQWALRILEQVQPQIRSLDAAVKLAFMAEV